MGWHGGVWVSDVTALLGGGGGRAGCRRRRGSGTREGAGKASHLSCGYGCGCGCGEVQETSARGFQPEELLLRTAARGFQACLYSPACLSSPLHALCPHLPCARASAVPMAASSSAATRNTSCREQGRVGDRHVSGTSRVGARGTAAR